MPQPEGPISAVTAFGSTLSWMPAMIVFGPKPAVRSTTSIRRAGPTPADTVVVALAPLVALSLSLGTSITSGLSGVFIGSPPNAWR